MKNILATILVLMSVKYSRAQGLSYSLETASSSGTVYTINIASSPAVDVATAVANGKLFGSYAIEIYNLSSSTSTINCSFDPNISTTSSSQNYGREIPAGVGVLYHILSPIIKVWCMSQSVQGPTRATVTQLR